MLNTTLPRWLTEAVHAPLPTQLTGTSNHRVETMLQWWGGYCGGNESNASITAGTKLGPRLAILPPWCAGRSHSLALCPFVPRSVSVCLRLSVCLSVCLSSVCLLCLPRARLCCICLCPSLSAHPLASVFPPYPPPPSLSPPLATPAQTYAAATMAALGAEQRLGDLRTSLTADFTHTTERDFLWLNEVVTELSREKQKFHGTTS